MGATCESAATISPRELPQPPLQKPPLRFLLGEGEDLLARSAGFRRSPQTPAEIRPRRMRQVILLQIAP